MLIRFQTLQPTAMFSLPITLEINISRGIKFHVTGGATALINESRQRIYTVIKESKWHWPGQRITINVLPNEVMKSGGHFDLPLALGILSASGQIPSTDLTKTLIAGELGLDGSILPYQDPYNLALLASNTAQHTVLAHFTPNDLAVLKKLFPKLRFISVTHFSQATSFAIGLVPATGLPKSDRSVAPPKPAVPCMSEVAGQRPLKRALEIAAAGGHHLLVVGPPGVGKSMLAARFSGIQPPPNPEEQLQIQSLRSAQGGELGALQNTPDRPFEKATRVLNVKEIYGKESAAALWDKLQSEQPRAHYAFDEVTLQKTGPLPMAHRCYGGTMMLDEFAAYPLAVRNELLHTMDQHKLAVILAMNPCPCGNYNHPHKTCTCSATALRNYQNKITGPLRDRLDMVVYTTPLLWSSKKEESSKRIQQRVEAAWRRQIQRQGVQNAQLSTAELEGYCAMKKATWQYYYKSCAERKVSIRGQQSLLAVARTLADLADADVVGKSHITAAFALRYSDRPSIDKPPRTKPTTSAVKKPQERVVNFGNGQKLTVTTDRHNREGLS